MRERSLKKRKNLFVRAAVFAFIVFCTVTIISQQLEFSELDSERTDLKDSIYRAQDDIEEINENLARVIDDEYIKQIARSKLNYHMPDEIIFYNDLQK